MEEDISGDIGLSTPFGRPSAPNLTHKAAQARRAPPPPAIDLPPPNAAAWKVPSPNSPNITSPTSAVPLSPVRSPRLVRARTMPRLSSRLEPQISDPGQTEALEENQVAKLQRWVISVAVVDFDLDIGPVVAKLYPNIKLDSRDREGIAFSSFPDTTLFDTGTQTHSFKIRLSQTLSFYPTERTDILYGYACFMQRKDSTSKRGYLQRSLVFLSHLPYVGLFDRAVNIFGPMFFGHGSTMLQSGCLNICNWPDPTPGHLLELGLLGSVVTTELPRSDEEPQHSYPIQISNDVVIASLPTQSMIPLLTGILPKLWSLWECLVLCDPVLVFAPSPSISSTAVWWLRDLLRPLPFAGDIRPYFHIHDRDFSALVSKNAPRAGLILGVTNPYFENVCKHWPHILSIGSGQGQTNTIGRGIPSTALASQSFGPSVGYHTKHNRYISKDSALLKKIEAAMKGGSSEQSRATELLRQHFTQRSQQVLAPLNRYFSSLLPKPSEASSPTLSSCHPSPSPSLHAPSPGPSRIPSPAMRPKPISSAISLTSAPMPDLRVKPFNTKDFLASLKRHGAQLPFRSPGKQKEFYERWTKSPAFGAWISGRVDAAQHVLNE